METISSAITKVASFSVLLYLFLFMFTVLGMELFSNTLRFNMDNEKIDPFGDGHGDVSKYFSIPDSNFNDILSATLSVFIV